MVGTLAFLDAFSRFSSRSTSDLHMYLPDIRLQVAATTLYDELNFTRAAERLGITQPALSKRIAELEKRLGFIVFKRDQKRVELTDAGRVFVRGCKDSQAILEKSIRIARSTHEDVQPVVTIGHSPYVNPVLVTALFGIQLPLYPGLRLHMESMFASDLAQSVLSAELDLAIIAEPSENPLLTIVPIAAEPLCAVMASDHPAATQKSVEIGDFSGAGWMIFPRKAHPVIYDRVVESGRAAGVTPLQLHHYMGANEAVQLISENFGVALMPKGLAEGIRDPDITVRPFNAKPLQISNYLVLRADQSSRLVNEFGRAFLKKSIANQKVAEASGQLLLKL